MYILSGSQNFLLMEKLGQSLALSVEPKAAFLLEKVHYLNSLKSALERMSLACSICLEKSMEPRRFSLSSIMRSNLSDASPVSIGTDAIASAMTTSIGLSQVSFQTSFGELFKCITFGFVARFFYARSLFLITKPECKKNIVKCFLQKGAFVNHFLQFEALNDEKNDYNHHFFVGKNGKSFRHSFVCLMY